jgi:signal transduction histidine kinase
MSFLSKKPNPTNTEGADSLSATDINEILYKRNAELAIKNKALSLLSHLYEISILTLKPNDIAHSVSESVRTALNYEFVSIFLYNQDKDTLTKIGVSTSDRFSDELKLSGHSFENIDIDHVSQKDFFQHVIIDRLPELHQKFGYILHNVLDTKEVDRLADRAHLKSSLVYPLKIGDRVLGIFVVGMNREYEALPEYEKEIIANIVNVVSLAVDKSLVYEELHVANEKLKDLDKLKTEFLSLASHQLRSPLTAIKGYTSMLLEGSFGQISPDQKEAIDRVFQSSVHLAKVVEDLLNVSKIEQGGMKYEMAPFDFEKVAHDLATDLSITAEKKGLKLLFETDNKAPYTVNGDAEKIRQVVLNIIDNSIKYTETGSITVSLKKTDPKILRLDVIDTGMGISAEEKEKLFQKFGRGAGGKTNTGGSGLGLYLAKQIAEAHGGRIAIDSPGVGKGSTFSIELKEV